MYGDGTRRYSEVGHLTVPVMAFFNEKADDGWEQIGIAVYGSGAEYNPIGFLGYDGSMSLEPVNQMYDIVRYREHAARYAQQLNVSLSTELFTDALPADKLIVKQVMQALIGSSARRYAVWETVDPGGNNCRRKQ